MGRRFLMFPWQVGAGHTGRCLALAAILGAAGHEVRFAADPTGDMVRAAGLPVLGGTAAPRRLGLPRRDYLAVTGPDNAYASVGYYHPVRLREQVERDRALIRSAAPDVVVTHMQPTAVLAARCEGVEVVSVADADFFVTGPHEWMPWTVSDGDVPRLSPFPPSLPAFRQVARELGLPEPEEVSDLLVGDLALIASVPEIERPAERYLADPRIHYVGPLLWDPDTEGELGRRLDSFGTADDTRVYVSVGGGAVAATDMASAAVGAADTEPWALLLATGQAPSPESVPPDARVLLHRFGGLRAAADWADVVVCHGGHSTVLAGLLAGKPVLVIPAMSENEGNGRSMVEHTGAGLCLRKTGAKPTAVPVGSDAVARGKPIASVVSRWSLPGGDPRPELDSELLAAAVRLLHSAPTYKQRATALGARLRAAADEAPERVLGLLDEAGLLKAAARTRP
ncbi:glycosyltransferase [Streptomyces avermitilis]|uniref:glycosyltransferase n=1 Tax=Streptomyces avermitilis TaxID=33903 RepID=UPI0033AE9381